MTNQTPGNQMPEADPVATMHAPNRGALVTQSPGLPTPMAMAGPAPATDVIRGGMDSSSLFHAFRRRWLRALCLGLLAGAATGAVLFWLFPESSSAVAMFRVDSKQKILVMDGSDTNDTSFDTYRATQLAWLKNAYVHIAALRSPEIANSVFFKDVDPDKKVEYLAEQLQVSFSGNSELMQIKLTGSVPKEELEKIVEAISQAYLAEVVWEEKGARMKPRDILRSSARKLSNEIKRLTDDYYRLVDENGDPAAFKDGVDPDTRMMFTNLASLQKQRDAALSNLAEEQTSYAIQMRYYTNPAVREALNKQAVEADPTIAAYREQAMQVRMAAEQMAAGGSGRASRQAQEMMAQASTLEQQARQYAARMQAMMEAEQEDEPDVNVMMLRETFAMKKTSMQQQIAKAEQEIEKIMEELRTKGKINTDLELKKAEIEQLQSIRRSIAERIEEWDIEAEAPDRITRIPGVEKTPAINTFQRYAISGLGGLTMFGLTCFGIAYMEFRNRRLNGAEQIDEGLGIRVVGTLPSLSGRKSLDPRHPVVAQLTESIDSVRTALMHESTTKRRQVVLVTSAETMEGRTTVASQLAASLARAGRRTLLIDGDLRRPALHTLFDSPLEDGLSEVLRAETDVADVIRPTHAEGLWLMTAGYCDADAVHALATDQAQPIFDKLRSEYDFIIIDGAPIIGLSDSLLFGQHCDGAILSVLRDHSNVPKIHQSAELLQSVGIRLIGAVVNGMPIKADRRVTHLQLAGSKAARKQIEMEDA